MARQAASSESLVTMGTRKKIVFCIFAVACLYTVWTTFHVTIDHGQGLKRRCQDTNSCLQNDLSLGPTHSTSKAIYYSYRNSSTKVSKPPPNTGSNTNNDILTGFKNKWVGFPDLTRCNCSAALSQAVNNSRFPSKVARKFPGEFLSDSKNCLSFQDKYGFNRYPGASQEELEFPIAFIILFYNDLDQVMFLLRALYRPHNVYCLSVDTKSSVEFLKAVSSVARCLPNVFVASKLENIVYAGFTRLMADIDCMDDLLRHPVQWKYVINMPGQQFPLRTNLEMVKILQTYNGANDVEGIIGNRMLPQRYKWKHRYVRNNVTGEVILMKTSLKNGSPPHNLEIVKGSAYGTFSRKFVEFVINDPVAIDFLKWSKSVASPDEYFWATLHHTKAVRVPGGYTAGAPDKKPWLTTYASWGGSDPCSTIRTRSICIFSPADLPLLMKQHALFANKFYITHHPAALHCLDELLYNLTFTRTVRDLSYYKTLPFALPKS